MKKLLANRKLVAACGALSIVTVVLLGTLLHYNLVVLPNQRYETAVELFEAGNYAEAYETLGKVPKSKDDTAQRLPYYEAYADFSAGDYATAAQKFERNGDYADSLQMTKYCKANDFLEQKKYSEAYGEFAALGGFRDSKDMLKECPYRLARDLMTDGDFEGALNRFAILLDYKDSGTQAKECSYQLALATLERKEYGEAYNAFFALGDYSDSVAMLSECRYRMAEDLMIAGDLLGALERYDALTGYKDSDVQAQECRYQYALALAEENTVESLSQAIELFSQVGEYKDAVQRVTDATAALEEAKRVPYSPPPEAYFDIDCTDPTNIKLKAYRFPAVFSKKNPQKARVFYVPSQLCDAAYMSPTSSDAVFRAKDFLVNNEYGDEEGFSLGSDWGGRPIKYTVTGKWTEGGVVRYDNGKSAIRIGNRAIVLSGEDGMHNTFLQNVQRGRTIDNYDGMVGGAIVFDEYTYIDLSGMRFSGVSTISLKPIDGPAIRIRTNQSGGEVTETYRGVDIYTGTNVFEPCAYVHITPDIYLVCEEKNSAKSRQALRELIDNYHHL